MIITVGCGLYASPPPAAETAVRGIEEELPVELKELEPVVVAIDAAVAEWKKRKKQEHNSWSCQRDIRQLLRDQAPVQNRGKLTPMGEAVFEAVRVVRAGWDAGRRDPRELADAARSVIEATP